MNRKRKILAGALTAALLLTLSIPAFATSGDVAGRRGANLDKRPRPDQDGR